MERFFNPKSVAVIGASRNPSKLGHVIIQNMVTAGFKGKIYPINPNAHFILHLPCFSSVLAVPYPIETAIVCVPSTLVTNVLEECGQKGIKHIIMITAGFGEIGNHELDKIVLSILKKYNMRMVGPNCLGTLDTYSNFDNLFLPRSRLTRPQPGIISFICQSGAVGSATLDLLAKEGMRFAKFVSYGNALDVDESDMLEYLGNDPKTRIICIYIEGIRDGKKFMRIAANVSKKKPIIAIKGGVTAAGAKATLSHTASLAGAAGIYKAAFKQCNLIYAETLEDLFNYAKILEKAPKPKGKRVQIITNGGGFGILATDSLSNYGMEITEPSEKTKRFLKNRLPPEAIIHNPIDLTGSVTTEAYKHALNAALEDKNVDAILLIVLLQTPLITPEIIDVIKEAKMRHAKKPIVVVSTGGHFTEMYMRHMEELGIPCFVYPNNAAKALKALCDYYTRR